MADNKLYIPTFIADDKFNPARIQPRVFYYNGLIDAPEYKVYHWNNSSGFSATVATLDVIPYVDHYSAETGSLPNSGSNSLLFYNEVSSYGTTPSNTLFSEYWDTYIELLYNPRTRLITADAVIPLADYFEIELNDIIEWRGNLYHLRAVNDYSFTDGTCNLQLLGPIIPDSLSPIITDDCYSYDLYGDNENITTFNFISCPSGAPQSIQVEAQQVGFIACAERGSVTKNTQGSSIVENSPCG